jgi:hypothetical protein
MKLGIKKKGNFMKKLAIIFSISFGILCAELEKNAFIFQDSDLPFFFIEFEGHYYYVNELLHWPACPCDKI